MNNEERFIPSIFNYCDRWCERCGFARRCKVFAMESEHALEDSDDPMGDAIKTVAIALADAKRMLLEKADEMGFDMVAAANSREVAESLERQHEAVNSQDAFKLAYDYALKARHTLEASSDWVEDFEDPISQDMLAILNQYLYTIAAKINRGYHAILDFDGYEDADELANPQSDANGSIKIALIQIERSLLAWTYLLNDSNSAAIRPWTEKLERTRFLLETKFPHAREFIRPGFDEIGGIM